MLNKKKSLELKNLKLEEKSKVDKKTKKELQLTIEDLRDTIDLNNRQHQRIMDKKNDKIEAMEDLIDVLESSANKAIDLIKGDIELSEREAILEAKESKYANFGAEIKKVEKEAKELAATQYKTGYSDGLADGLRKVHEITAEDRKQAMQVAALAASSHTPGAAKIVARSIQDNLLNPGPEATEEEFEAEDEE